MDAASPLLQRTAAFARGVVGPGAPRWEAERRIAREAIAEAAAIGLTGLEVPPDLGGLGLGLLPDFSAVAHLHPQRLVTVLPDWQPRGFFGETLFAIRPWSAQVPRAVQCFVDHLREHFAQGFT